MGDVISGKIFAAGEEVDAVKLALMFSGSLLSPDVLSQILTPPGSVIDFAGATPPAGWLICDGSEVSRVAYASLFAALGETYGAGDGSATFNIPDARGRVSAGLDTPVSAAYADRLTAAGTGNPGVDSRTLGANGGADRHALTPTEGPAHTHSYQVVSFNQDSNGTGGGGSPRVTSANSSIANTGAAGSGAAHPNVPPVIVFQKIIKF